MSSLKILDAIIDAARKGWSATKPVSVELIRSRLEWSWGLEYGTLDEHVQRFCAFSDLMTEPVLAENSKDPADPHLTDIMMDDTFILVANGDLVRKLYFVASNLSESYRESRIAIQDFYEGAKIFEYLVLPVDPATKIAPRLLLSPVPPHLTISISVDKLLKRWGYSSFKFDAAAKSLIKFSEASPPTNATFLPDLDTFVHLRCTHERWAMCYIAARFFGEDSEMEEASDGAQSSTMEWEVQTISNFDEPCRRMLPHEFEQEPVVKIRQALVYNEEDEAISCDSHITGAEDSEEYLKASIARADYADPSWLTWVENWAEGAERVDDDEMLLNDEQIEEDSKEGPRVATSLDLTKPDYLSKPKLLSRNKIRVVV
ncbi:hypothetical protein B0H17DRAFT_1327837 [Mycena rosella]|uniref:Uncharacterized protein n=1 Tax=Mycena rosella TaxID=1033263 RepID=A0AAD7DWH2_MYCRO|nr:hypothetical protein B0H17DRAFT_1327837 [Mycena rosella]